MFAGIVLSAPAARPAPSPIHAQGRLRFRTLSLRVGLLAGGVTLLALVAYGLTLAPTITWQHDAADSGELAAAAYTFGVPHPTGYPLWLLLAALVARLGPASSVAFRLNWFSAVSAALAAGLLAALVALLADGWFAPSGAPALDGPSRPALVAGGVSGVALATATGVWNIAVVTETYALHLLLVVGLIAVTLLGADARARALLAGVALANHMTVVPVALGALLFNRSTARVQIRAFLFLLPGLSLYLLLPLRAFSHPASNWGDPQTPTAFLALVTGSAYRYLLVVPSPIEGVTRLAASIHALVTQFPWPFWLPAIIGLPALRRQGHTRPWLVVGGIYLLFPVFYRAAGVEHYLLPGLVVLALAAGAGAYRLAFVAQTWRAPGTAVAVVALVAAGGVALVTGGRTSSLRGDRSAQTWATLALQNAQPQAILLTSDDGRTFALWYMQRVEHLRPDVQVVDQRLWQQPWYRRQMEAGT